MGIAEVVPGVSGGTIAFVTGIYRDLIETLATFNLRSLPMLLQWSAFYTHHRLSFLIPLGVGMALGVILFAQVMSYLLAHYQPLVWAFFSGLILMSVYTVGRYRSWQELMQFATPGLLAGLALLLIPGTSTEPGYLSIFLGGAIAVCAWLLPAVSGSFILLALGLYGAVINAISDFQVDLLLVLAAGCVIGIMLFARALSWLLAKAQNAVFGFFTGFMAGSVAKLWPWQQAGVLMTPHSYADLTLQQPMLLGAGLAFVLGMGSMIALAKVVDQDGD